MRSHVRVLRKWARVTHVRVVVGNHKRVRVPRAHIRMRDIRATYESDAYIYVHAGGQMRIYLHTFV